MGGDAENMNCETCKDDQIEYNNSCFDLNDTLTKSFFIPKNNSISNCLEKFGLYIKEDSNECIPKPNEDEGYFISDTQNGILSKCHENCLSCKNGPIKNDTGKIKSMECIKCKDANNLKKK